MLVAQVLRKSERYLPDLLFTFLPPYKTQEGCRINGITARDPSGRLFPSPLEKKDLLACREKEERVPGSMKKGLWYLIEGAPSRIKILLYNWGHFFFLDRIYSLPFWLWYCRRRLQTALKIIAQYDLLILAEDNVGYETAVWIKAAHSRGIPAGIVPVTVATALEPAESIFGNRAYSI
jgi:hypothetical protein